MLADGAVGEMVLAHFTSIALRLKTPDDWRNDETMAGGDAFFEEGIHWLHLAGSLGPRSAGSIHGFRPAASRGGVRRSPRQEHDGGVPLRQRRGRVALLLARDPVAFEGCGSRRSRPRRRDHLRVERLFVSRRGKGFPRLIIPGFRDIRGYQAMYRDFRAPMRDGRAPEMSLERAMEDQRLMDRSTRPST
jgi:predicted dehydrogenase